MFAERMNLAVCFGSLILLSVFRASCTCLIPRQTPNVLLLSLMVRNDSNLLITHLQNQE